MRDGYSPWGTARSGTVPGHCLPWVVLAVCNLMVAGAANTLFFAPTPDPQKVAGALFLLTTCGCGSLVTLLRIVLRQLRGMG